MTIELTAELKQEIAKQVVEAIMAQDPDLGGIPVIETPQENNVESCD